MQLNGALLFQQRRTRKKPSQTKKKICSGAKAYWEKKDCRACARQPSRQRGQTVRLSL